MKKSLLILIFGSVFFISCSNEHKAKKAIKEYLSKNMHDFKSYEPVEYGIIDSMFTFYYEDSTYLAINETVNLKIDTANTLLDEYKSKMNSYQRGLIAESTMDSIMQIVSLMHEDADSLVNISANIKENYKPEFNGYSIAHSFRGKNGAGGLILNRKIFFLDPSFEKVVKVEDVETDMN